jgi:hypothetical protein
MSPPEMRTAALVAGGDRRGYSKSLAAQGTYPLHPETATDFARAVVAERHRLSLHLAALVVELAGLGAHS